MAKLKGAFDPRFYSSNPDQVIPYNASANRRPTYKRFLYVFALAALVWVAGATLRTMVHTLPWVS